MNTARVHLDRVVRAYRFPQSLFHRARETYKLLRYFNLRPQWELAPGEVFICLLPCEMEALRGLLVALPEKFVGGCLEEVGSYDATVSVPS